ncbi:MAG: Crp/Fnr family transcriptional regulator [Hyphomicrobiaceae bacterium]
MRSRLERSAFRRTLAPGEILFSRDDVDDNVYFVLAGTLRIIIHAPNGRVVLFRDLGPGEAIGELAAIDGGRRSATVEARGPAQVMRVRGQAFRDLVAREVTVAMALLQQSIRYVRELTDRVYEFSSLAVANRIQAELLRLAREVSADGNSVLLSPAPRHVDIADRVSTHREAVTRELGRLARIGIVERQGRRLRITDMKRLSVLVDEAANC